MKLLICFGTRPEAIKMVAIILELEKRGIPFKICVTAQHREMLDQVLKFFKIKPDYDLNLMMQGQSLNSLSAKIFEKIDPILDKEKPDLILVQGDTTTAAIISIAAFHRRIKIGHIEAGLRTYNISAPFPEEANRQIISRIADIHFSPTEGATTNLITEGISKEKIFLTGNTGIDAQYLAFEKILNTSDLDIIKLEALLNSSKKLILVTGHRRESFGLGLKKICQALLEISFLQDVELIYPVHLNPKVKDTVFSYLSNKENIHLIDPLPYHSMLWLMQRCNLIITDSGGIQEEAPTFKKPLLVTRKLTERMEGVVAGFSFLVGTNRSKIIETAKDLLQNPPDYSMMNNPYGDGKAAQKIVDILSLYFK